MSDFESESHIGEIRRRRESPKHTKLMQEISRKGLPFVDSPRGLSIDRLIIDEELVAVRDSIKSKIEARRAAVVRNHLEFKRGVK